MNPPKTKGIVTFYSQDNSNIKNYDLCIKSNDYGAPETAQIIADLFRKKMHL